MKKENVFLNISRQWFAGLLLLIMGVGSVQAAGLLKAINGSQIVPDIRSHKVAVVIEDGYAITTVDQVFFNPSTEDIEAIYSFPIPEKAAVSELTLWIDGKAIHGEVLAKQRAKKIYQQEKAAGRDAALTEQDGYKTFDTRVSPVRAGQETRIRLVYIQPAHIDTGIGRYVYPLEDGGVDDMKTAFWTAKTAVKEDFSFDLQIRSAYPVAAVRVPDQSSAQIKQLDDQHWHVLLSNQKNNLDQEEFEQSATQSAGPVFNLDKDLVVYWRHKTGLPGSVDLITQKQAGQRGTFMMVLTPGDDLQQITEGRDWTFVLDISGSMRSKYATLAEGIKRALNKLNSNDRFQIILFNDDVTDLTQGYVTATAEQVLIYSDKLANINTNKGTNLYAGLLRGLNSLDADRTSAIVLVTDGVANVGETAQRKFIDLVAKKDVRLFTMVMGNSANRPLLNALTQHSNGFATNISNSDDIVGQLISATSKVTHQAMHDVEVKIKGIKTADIQPQLIGSLYRGQQLVLFGHYWESGAANVSLSGKISGQKKQYQSQFDFPEVSDNNPELERLWAFATIESQMQEIEDFGEDADLKQSVTELGVEYGLVTEYTSMLVAGDQVFQEQGIKRLNRDRINKEQQARQHRSTNPVVNRRVDHKQPMFKKSRSSYGGGGFDGFQVILIALLLLILFKHKPWIINSNDKSTS
ncbi:MAG: VIT and VWA domain-containing protein [Methylococcaceae bacterium]